jgi:hypothetical protein
LLFGILIGSTGWQRPKSIKLVGEGCRTENGDEQTHKRNRQ